MKSTYLLLIFLIVISCWWLYGNERHKGPMTSITVHEWMIDSIARNGKLTYQLNHERFNREKAEAYGYSFHSDGGLNNIEAHLRGATQSLIGTHWFKKGTLTMDIDGKERQLYYFRRTPRQLILKNNERTIWLSRYHDHYTLGFPDAPGHPLTEWKKKKQVSTAVLEAACFFSLF